MIRHKIRHVKIMQNEVAQLPYQSINVYTTRNNLKNKKTRHFKNV